MSAGTADNVTSLGRPILVIGGCGFIGTNLVDRLLSEGHTVRVLDNLSREGVSRNRLWLEQRHGRRLTVEVGDVRDAATVRRVMKGVDFVFHLAAQVAVTTSVVSPLEDFEVNARGTINVLEAARAQPKPPGLLFTSTNKVYGALDDLVVEEDGDRYAPRDEEAREQGVSEDRPLDFHSPYGCSKGAADQYVLDWARTYGLKTCVFRMSCIYGPHQCGNEDQGWVAHFILEALAGRTITLYGTGLQVRDVLHVDDLVNAMLLATRHLDTVSGRAFNLGGGPQRATSLLEVLELIQKLQGSAVRLRHGPWRTGDQRWYVSDTRRFQRATGWRPQVSIEEGLAGLMRWFIAQGRKQQVEAHP